MCPTCSGENNVTLTARGGGGHKPDIAVGLAGPSADTEVTAREENADATHAEIGKQVAHGLRIAPRDTPLVVSVRQVDHLRDIGLR